MEKVPINARVTGLRVSPFQWAWAALLAVSLAVILVVGNVTEADSRASLGTWALVAAVLVPALIACVIGRTAPRVQPVRSCSRWWPVPCGDSSRPGADAG
jgi:drug/metabolite transporter (DMT)-like permease